MTDLQSDIQSPSTAVLPVAGDKSGRVAYDLTRGRIAQVPEAGLPHITLEITSTSTVVLTAVKQVRPLRPEFEKHLPTLNLTDIDQLEQFALALFHLHSSWLFASDLPEVLPERIQRATVLRDILVSQVSALSKLNLVDGAVLNDLKGAVGHRNIATDVSGMAGLLRRNWPKVGTRVGITMAELDEAESLAGSILDALSQRERAEGEQADFNLERQKAFKLLIDTYDELRRAVTYLRWHENDVDRFAPSLFAGRGPRRKGDNAEPAQPGPQPAIPAPSAPQSTLPAGHPDSEPFTS